MLTPRIQMDSNVPGRVANCRLKPDLVIERIVHLHQLRLAEYAEVLGEPGRALSAPGLSAVVEVLLRKGDRLFINDGMFGIFWLLRIDGPNSFPVRAYRDGLPYEGETREFQINGPTCDSTDTLPGLVELPVDIGPGDYLEFGNIGAYSIGGRTDYNGFFSDRIVTITSPSAWPPLVEDLSAT
jgi:ornithine decarboxylase